MSCRLHSPRISRKRVPRQQVRDPVDRMIGDAPAVPSSDMPPDRSRSAWPIRTDCRWPLLVRLQRPIPQTGSSSVPAQRRRLRWSSAAPAVARSVPIKKAGHPNGRTGLGVLPFACQALQALRDDGNGVGRRTVVWRHRNRVSLTVGEACEQKRSRRYDGGCAGVGRRV